MKTTCPGCKQFFDVETENIGWTAQCPLCGTEFVVQALQENQTIPQAQPDTSNNPVTSPSPQAYPVASVQTGTPMKPLTCEMCGSTSLLKQDGVFVCQSCGTKYSVEEAKKMMIAGTVNVAGTVTIDNSAFVKKYLVNARRALQKEDWEEVEKYYNMVEQNVPNNMEAVFFSSYGRAMLSLYDDEFFKREQKFKVLNNSISVINDYYEVTTEDKELVLRRICNAVEKMQSVGFVYNKNVTFLNNVGSYEWNKELLKSVAEAVLVELQQIHKVHPEKAYIQELMDNLTEVTNPEMDVISMFIYGCIIFCLLIVGCIVLSSIR